MRKILWGVLLITAALIVVVVANIAIRVRAAQQQGTIVSQVHALGGKVRYDFDFVQPPPPKSILHSVFGDDFVGHVIEVDFSNQPIGDADLVILNDLPTMTRLGLYDTDISDDGLKTVGTFHQLEFLWLDGTPVTDDGIEHLVELQNLTELLVQYTAITDGAMAHISRLPNLQHLSLGETVITDDGIAKLRRMDLTALKLDGTNVTDECAETLDQFRNLEHLDLFSTQVTDRLILDTCHWSKLWLLRIHDTAISDASVPALSRLKSLRHASLSETMISDAGVQKLQDALPGAEIHRQHKQDRIMPCTRSTACKFSQMEGRLSVPGDGKRSANERPASQRMVQRFNIVHLLAVTGLAALLFAALQFSRPFAQATIVIFVWGAFHVSIAKRYRCYESIFAGAASAFFTAILIPHVSGGWEFGGSWIGLLLDPMTVIRWIAMASVGGFVQVQYVHAHREQERRFQLELMRHARAPLNQKAEP